MDKIAIWCASYLDMLAAIFFLACFAATYVIYFVMPTATEDGVSSSQEQCAAILPEYRALVKATEEAAAAAASRR